MDEVRSLTMASVLRRAIPVKRAVPSMWTLKMVSFYSPVRPWRPGSEHVNDGWSNSGVVSVSNKTYAPIKPYVRASEKRRHGRW
jgi:hypothetical protein